ncbi:propionyl-CoA carboxylase beta chain [Streptomyces sp. SLBN-118]|uniref:acyl-CoA carboxylase subunit beta n=1 Tax=Streptomyces sp. SLBN-118 TaxID=2768454 RepID=UPI001152C04D|nr:acyl-CoA carboxylase subunit beta [Streptomyces sp. SLBN-118]TQK43040.1 propionyl-CoA carboxylase beta chain [Streptomyces sp. SLBN-118]
MATSQSSILTARRHAENLHHPIEQAVHTLEAQHAQAEVAQVTARARVEQLLDQDSLVELDAAAGHRLNHAELDGERPYGDGVVTGYGTVDGRPVAVFAQDSTVFGEAMGEAVCRKIAKVMDFALKTGCPVIGISDSRRAGVQAGGSALGTSGETFRRHVHASGVVPQISLVLGSCDGPAVFSPALTDFTVIAERTSHMLTSGPEVIRTVTGEDIDIEELGGARTHSTVSGVAHCLAGDAKEAMEYVRALLSHLPSNNLQEPPAHPDQADLETCAEDLELDTVVPDSTNQPYDMHHVIEHVIDDYEFLETQPLFAPNLITGFCRIEGHPVGIVANQPLQLAGCLDIDACEKAARFVRTCDAFNVPVVTFVDVPGFVPATDQEHQGIIRRGAKLIYAYAEATVPLITVITRKAFAGAYDLMGSKHLGADLNLAWPTAQIAVMGPQSAVGILHGVSQTGADLQGPVHREEKRAELMSEYGDALLTPFIAAERGYIDAVVKPSETRQHVIRGLRALRTKRETLPPKKHGNIPL